MMNLAEYRHHSQSLADFLPWAALVRESVILNKDGSFQRTAKFRGPDLDSSTPAELVAITSRLNNALRRLGTGWAIFIEAQRQPARSYPFSDFPEPASRLVDAERRAQFEEEGAHFESRYFLTLLWLPPADDSARAEAWLYENRAHACADWRAALDGFVDRTDRVLALVEGFMPEAEWLDDGETLTYLHSCVSTRRQQVRVPETPIYLDAILVDEDLTGGLEPRLGRAHLRTLTLMGFPSAGRSQPPGFPLSLGDARHLPRQDRRDQGARQNPTAMVRQTQVDHGDPEGGDDQRGVGADGL
jgi:type IV secretion system protein TrbE